MEEIILLKAEDFKKKNTPPGKTGGIALLLVVAVLYMDLLFFYGFKIPSHVFLNISRTVTGRVSCSNPRWSLVGSTSTCFYTGLFSCFSLVS